MQRLVARVEGDAARLARRIAVHRLEEIERIADGAYDLLIAFLQRRVADKFKIPILRMMQVGEAAADQCTYKVQREGRALVAAQQQLRIRLAIRRREAGAVDVVAPIARQRDTATCFRV